MSQAPQGRKDWVRSHYDKILLMTGLVALLFSSVWLIKDIQAGRETAAFATQRLSWQGSAIGLEDTVGFEEVLGEARRSATAPLETRERTTVSALRVSCVKCGRPIPYDAVECPFCLAEQPPIINIDTLDTDDDGIPDKIELSLGLNPQDPADAEGDLDGDGFSNLEEVGAGHDPKDPGDMPDPVVKLRVGGIKPVPFYLRFVGRQKLADGTDRFQLNLQSRTRTYFAKMGDVILGYKVAAYNPQGTGGLETLTMVRQSDQYQVELVKGRPVTEKELAILLVSLLDKSRLPVLRLNDEFEYRGQGYKVVDIGRDSVIIHHADTGDSITVPLLSPEERAELVRPARPAAESGTDAPW